MTTSLTNINNKRPKPRKLNNGMITALSEAIAKGNYAVTACQLCGIPESTLYNWLSQAQKDTELGVESPYTCLMESLKKAEAQAEAELVRVVRETATKKKEWLPAITFLERRHPDRWGRRDKTTVDINENKNITITRVTVIKDYGEGYKELERRSGELIEGEVIEEE